MRTVSPAAHAGFARACVAGATATGRGLSLATLLVAASAWLGNAPVQGAVPIPVFVTIEPQAYFVERIGGERVRVEVLVGPGQCAETFEATPKQLARMSGARLYFTGGMPMEETLVPRLRGSFPGMVVIDTQTGIDRRLFDDGGEREARPGGVGGRLEGNARGELPGEARGEHAHEATGAVHAHEAPGTDHAHEATGAEHAHTGLDPHTWLDPTLAKVIARNITSGLVQVDPADSSLYRANLRSLEADLDRVDAEIRALLAPAQGRTMLVYHPYFGYFARAYGLRQVAIEAGGFRPGSKYLAGVIDSARRQEIRAIFVQEGVARSAAEAVAREIGGQVIILDPLSRDYLVNLREMAQRVREGLTAR